MWCSDRRGLLRLAGLGALALLVPGCGFEPLYATGTPAATMLGRIDTAPLSGEAGFLLHERLVERLGPADGATHRLLVDLDLEQVGVVLTTDNDTTRYNVIGTAAFTLSPFGGGAAFSDEVRAITGYSAPDTRTATTFASLSARRDAERRLARMLADRIVQRLALTAPEWSA